MVIIWIMHFSNWKHFKEGQQHFKIVLVDQSVNSSNLQKEIFLINKTGNLEKQSQRTTNS